MASTATFPSEVVRHILQYATVCQLGIATCLNKEWNESVEQSSRWSQRAAAGGAELLAEKGNIWARAASDATGTDP